MPAPRPTIRTIAAALGVSRSTVSNALRALPSVNAETRRRVSTAAAEMGYVSHPFATEVMSQLRRSSKSTHLGTLAVLEMDEPGRPPGAAVFNAELCAGIERRAAEIGFSVTHWRFGGGTELPQKRLGQILHWRGIYGLILLPTWREPDLAELDWGLYTGLYLDYLIRNPPLHTISSDHFRTLFEALERVRNLGYRRAGLAIPARSNERLNGRWVAGYLGYMHDHPEMKMIPPLVVDEIRRENFGPWFRRNRPDVVLTHWTNAPRWMAAEGAVIPETHGYVCLNVLHAAAGVSGFDLQPQLLGARASELIIAQLGHRDRGIPTVPSNTLIPSRWVNGSSLKATI